MKTTPTIVAIALLSASAGAFAGEDSTGNWGAGGTGLRWYQTECGLEGFPGPSVDAPKPCTVAGKHYQTSENGIVPTPLGAAVGGGQRVMEGIAANDGHGGRKAEETRK